MWSDKVNNDCNVLNSLEVEEVRAGPEEPANLSERKRVIDTTVSKTKWQLLLSCHLWKQRVWWLAGWSFCFYCLLSLVGDMIRSVWVCSCSVLNLWTFGWSPLQWLAPARAMNLHFFTSLCLILYELVSFQELKFSTAVLCVCCAEDSPSPVQQ